MHKFVRMEQHFAVSKDGLLIHINDAHNSLDDFYCPHCGCRMLKKCGNIRSWHFAHDWRYADEWQKTCSYETYLHGYAKRRIKQWFDEAKSITLKFTHSFVCHLSNQCKLQSDKCPKQTSTESCDLKRIFDSCAIETPVARDNDKYRADLLLTNSSNKDWQLLIEICVNHPCTEKKKESGAQIIEFLITSEEDVEYIISHDIEESGSVRYFSINEVEEYKDLQPAPHNLSKFILHKSGRSFVDQSVGCLSAFSRHPKAQFEIIFSPNNLKHGILYLYGLLRAREQGIEVNNCLLCTHLTFDESQEGKKRCDINNTIIKCNSDALSCRNFQYNNNIHTRLSHLLTSSNLEIIDVWKRSMDANI